MLALLGSLLGFVSSAVPDIFKIFQDKRDKAHELEILKLQMQQQAQGHNEKLEEIGANADIAEMQALYKTYSTGVTWVDALNGTVRPMIAYAFFVLYAVVKGMQFHQGLAWQLWTDEDQMIFSGIISFYFGSRAMNKIRESK